ncbi:hypothetical protein TCSYLVIO_007227 [Trypanosoma cruzi]|nr:hypothetical protein TCSYLVIO_007227 [Trypanosoma cruzi]
MIKALRQLRKILCNSCYLLRVQFFFLFCIHSKHRHLQKNARDGASAPDLSARWLHRVAAILISREICYDAFTCVLFRGQCAGGCAVAGWRERSGGKCVGAAVKSRAGCFAAEGTAHPAQHRSCRASFITPQHRNRRHQHAARQRMPPPPRVRPEGTRLLLCFEGTRRVAQRRAHDLLAEYAHDTGHWPRSVCVMEDTAAESLLLSGGQTPDFLLFLTQADGCAMTPQQNEAFVFTMEGHYLWCYALGM